MAKKVTTMKLKVDDLQCDKCFKKVKKILCKFPEIRDQTYDLKQNIVTITVVCCNPEKMRDKICCKGGGCIKWIEIVITPPSSPPRSPPPPPPPPPVQVVIGICCVLCYGGRPCGRCFPGYGRPPPCCDGCYGRPACDSYDD